MKNALRFGIALSVCVAFGALAWGCASIIKGTKQDISINSAPGGADVVVKTKGGVEIFAGKTPCSVRLKKKQEYQVNVKSAGYREQTIWVDQGFEAWTIGNLACGGVIGLIVDAVNGAMYKLEPDVIYVTLVTAQIDGRAGEPYAVLQALDGQGQRRNLVVPLVK